MSLQEIVQSMTNDGFNGPEIAEYLLDQGHSFPDVVMALLDVHFAVRVPGKDFMVSFEPGVNPRLAQAYGLVNRRSPERPVLHQGTSPAPPTRVPRFEAEMVDRVAGFKTAVSVCLFGLVYSPCQVRDGSLAGTHQTFVQHETLGWVCIWWDDFDLSPLDTND